MTCLARYRLKLMAKTIIIDAEMSNRVPYLRGVLARSLNEFGIPFDAAYALATEIRQELADLDEITSIRLREMVVEKLRGRVDQKIIERYQSHDVVPPVIYVEGLDGQLTPYSESNFDRLEVIGLSRYETRVVANKMHNLLSQLGQEKIHVNHLGFLTYRLLHEDSMFGPKLAQRYLTWVNFSRSGQPLILLIGGTTGSGKSTLTATLANRLDIVRTQSTDMLREVMRMMIPQRLLPVLHESSFTAWQKLPAEYHGGLEDRENMLIVGYRTQAELLSVPCEAVIQRALKEQISLLLEGVHVTPSLLQKIPDGNPVVVVHVMLAVLKQKELKKRIKGRNLEAPPRAAGGHTYGFDDIWHLQEYLLDEADQADIPIVENRDREQAMREIMKIVMNRLAEGFESTPEELFGAQDADLPDTRNPVAKHAG